MTRWKPSAGARETLHGNSDQDGESAHRGNAYSSILNPAAGGRGTMSPVKSLGLPASRKFKLFKLFKLFGWV